VLVAGASIAGPALAHWLHRYGFAVTVVERAPALRPGGQAVDLRGVAKEAVRRMGLLEAVRAACTDTRGMSVVDEWNRPLVELRADMFDGDGFIAEYEILRGDLAEVLYRATEPHVEYLFGQRITGLDQDDSGVAVTLSSGARRRFDLVVGADGLHSGLRALVFGPESARLRDLGHLLAFFTVPNRLRLSSWMHTYAEPHRSAAIRSIHHDSEAMALLAVRGTRADYDPRDSDGQRELLRSRLAGMGWEVPDLLDRMDTATDFYFDSCSQVHLDRWSDGRVVLLGDAAFCASPISGQGTSLAVLGAYLLAGELAGAGGDHAAAFAAYESRMRPIVGITQSFARDNARHFAARNRLGLRVQRTAMRLAGRRPLTTLIARRMEKVVNGVELPDYRHLLVGAAG
jgi:2-polyprenyl-6-methoxyphenol hydroxylase-like FAD-dependent oxidoreductase